MIKALAFLVHGTVAGILLCAQLTLLTMRDAESLVQTIPEVVTAQEHGECPQFSVSYEGADQFLIQARRSCGATGGMLINNYVVDRRQSTVWQMADKPVPISDPAVESLGKELALRAHRRILSDTEARCLAAEAARALPGWGGGETAITVEPFGAAEGSEVRFNATHRWLSRPFDSVRLLTVDRDMAWVRDDETGENVMSEGLGALTSKLFAVRVPAWLTDEDTLAIAQQIPAAALGIREGCRLTVGGAFRTEDALVGLACNGSAVQGTTVVAVNLRTGKTTNADTGKVLESPESRRIAIEFLAERERKLADLRKEVDGICHQP